MTAASKSALWLLIVGLAAAMQALPAYARQRVDMIVEHGTVVTMDGERRILKDGALAIQGDAIAALDTTANIDAAYESANVLDVRGALLLPGLINAHTHMSMSLLRGLADDLSLDDWLNKYIFPAEHRYVTPEFVTWSTRLSLLEMLRGGTTTAHANPPPTSQSEIALCAGGLKLGFFAIGHAIRNAGWPIPPDFL